MKPADGGKHMACELQYFQTKDKAHFMINKCLEKEHKDSNIPL